MRFLKLPSLVTGLMFFGFFGGNGYAEKTSVVVAANFTGPVKEIADLFKAKTGYEAVLSFGSTGQLFAQIEQGAPFEVFLSADTERPKQAVDKGLAVPESRFTYAVGKLALWSRTASLVKGEESLRDGKFEKIAFANPEAAPYGTAAVETLKALKLFDKLEAKFVQGVSIAQTFQFIDTGNAELGFVALSQIIGKEEGSRWLVPQNLYTPIRQDAVLLKTGANNVAAKAFLEFLKGSEAIAVIERHGYGLESGK